MSELKACPFCGNKLETAPDGVFEETCRCRTKSMTVKEWNTRPIEDALRSENERIQSALTEAQEENKRYKDALEIANDRIDDYQTSFKVVLDEKCPKDEIHCGCVPILKYTLSNYRNNMVLITTFPEEPNPIITIKNIANNTLNENFYSDYSASKQVGEFWVERLNEKEYELMQIIKDLRVQLQSALNGGK